MAQCQTCKHWERWPHTKVCGSCKRYPPQWTGAVTRFISEDVEPKAAWANWAYPVTREDAKCGEHFEKPEYY